MAVLLANDQTRPGESISGPINPAEQFFQIQLLKALRYGIKGQYVEIVRILLDKGVLSRARRDGLHYGLVELAAKVGNKTIINMLEEERS